MARAATASARLGVPIDVSVWVGAELVAAEAVKDPIGLWQAAANLSPLSAHSRDGRRDWLRQLRYGASWSEDNLPWVWIPHRLSSLHGRQLHTAVNLVSDERWLRAALDLECAAARAGLTASEAWRLACDGATPPATAAGLD